MKEVIQEAVRLAETEEPAVLATVVRTKGSTPQKPGAKLLVRKDGTGVGTLGGGCVEGDIWYAAKEILRRKGGPEFKDYFLNEEIAARDGLVCGGTMYFFIEPLWKPGDFLPFGREMMGAYESGNPVSVAMVLKADSGRGVAGAKLLLREDGSTHGTLGDADLDDLALEAAQRVADLGTNEHLMTHDGTELYVEGFTTPPTLVLMGGGHVSKATYDLAILLKYRIYVVDDRVEFANRERFPGAEDTIVVSDYARGLDQVPINANTFIAIATRGHWFDDLALEAAIRTLGQVRGADGEHAEDHPHLPASRGDGNPHREAQAGACTHRPGHRRPHARGDRGEHNVGDSHVPAWGLGRPHDHGRQVFRPGRQQGRGSRGRAGLVTPWPP